MFQSPSSLLNIHGENIGKRFGKTWIFRELNVAIESGTSVAITGKNGAGKSTLLQILSGYLAPSEGTIKINKSASYEIEKISGSYVGPYTEIIEEMTLQELLSFHSYYKEPILKLDEMAEKVSLPLRKPITDFSTGMKQRVKLILGFYFKNEIIYLDEPTANLDMDGFNWWKAEMLQLKCTILVASNDPKEVELCKNQIVL